MSNKMSRRSMHRKRRKGNSILKAIALLFLLALLVVGGFLGYSYYRFNKSFEKVYNKQAVESVVKDVVKKRESTEEIEVGEDPISILFLGIDTGDFGRTEVGRSDIMMVATINPNTNKTVMTSIPRDTYTEIVGYGTQDKINHAYAFGGIPMSINSVQNFLDIPIDYYVKVDMGSFVQIVDALGGITIVPTETFNQEGTYFEQGVSQYMDGATVLQYVRNRYTEEGDYGRQQRSRQVIEAVADKVVNINSFASLPELMAVMEDYVETNIQFKDIQTLALNANKIAKNIEEVTLQGTGDMIDGVYYEMIDEGSLATVQEALKSNLEVN